MSDRAEEAFDEKAENLVSALSIDSNGWLEIVPSPNLKPNGGSYDHSNGSNVVNYARHNKQEEVIENCSSEDTPHTNIINRKEHEVFPGCRTLLQHLELSIQKDYGSNNTGCVVKDCISTIGTSTKDLVFTKSSIICKDINRAIDELVNMREIKLKSSCDNKKSNHVVGRDDKGQQTKVKSKSDQFSRNTSYCTQITFNTFNVLIPIIEKMLNHPERFNYNLELNGPRIAKIKKKINNEKDCEKRPNKLSCYLLFDKVYSITTVKTLENLRDKVDRLLLTCIPSDTKSLQPHLLWGTCRTSKEIIQKTFVFDKSNCIHNSFMKTVIGEKDLDIVEKFSKSVDAELIQPLAEHNKKIAKKQMNIVDSLCNQLKCVLEDEERLCGLTLTVYGSRLTELSLGRASDVDILLQIQTVSQLKNDLANKKISMLDYKKKMKDFVKEVRNKICEGGERSFFDVSATPYAPVPIIKGTFEGICRLGRIEKSINFDISFSQDISVANSKLLREYLLIDPRVKILMLSVKSWIKLKGVGNAAENTISSYSWMILVIFYLQCIDFVPVLQNPQFMAKHQEYHDQQNPLHCVDNFRTHFLTCSQVEKAGLWKLPDHFSDTAVSVLLAGFFIFYARHFPKHTIAVSIRLGKCVLQKSVFRNSKLWRLCIEDPFKTHCSHTPHNTGSPMNEEGQARVDKSLQDAADQMIHMFASCSDIQDLIGSFHHLSQDIEAQPSV